MENFASGWDSTRLVEKLSEGRELTKQLQINLGVPSSSPETQEFLLHRILRSYDQALSLLQQSCPGGGDGGDAPPADLQGSLPAAVWSSYSDDSDQDTKDQASRKRKALPTWTKKVNVSPETGFEGHVDDGYGWRKYGQKDILGAKHPRGYYRCTHRYSQGCLATRQVQRSNDDPTVLEITYKRQHTCSTRANSGNTHTYPPVPMSDQPNKDPNPLPEDPQEPLAGPSQLHQPLSNIPTGLSVMTQDLDPFPSPLLQPFDFPSSSTENGYIFSNGDNLLGNYSPNMLSPTTSGSNYFSIPTSDNYGELIPNLHVSVSELSPMAATMTSATNSPTFATNFPFGSSEFSFGNPGHYP